MEVSHRDCETSNTALSEMVEQAKTDLVERRERAFLPPLDFQYMGDVRVTASQRQAVGSSDGLAAAVEYEIRLAEKQINLLLLRIEQNPAIAANVRPFGSNLYKMKERLKKALAAANKGGGELPTKNL
jgi:hypothetical protein